MRELLPAGHMREFKGLHLAATMMEFKGLLPGHNEGVDLFASHLNI